LSVIGAFRIIFAAEVKLRAVILSYFPSKDGRPNFLELAEIARVLVRLDHVASFIVNRITASQLSIRRSRRQAGERNQNSRRAPPQRKEIHR